MKVRIHERSVPTYIMVNDGVNGIEIADAVMEAYDDYYTDFVGWQKLMESLKEAPEFKS